MTQAKDSKSTALKQDSAAFTASVAAVGGGPATAATPRVPPRSSLPIQQQLRAGASQLREETQEDCYRCRQTLYVALFFDGTGNNRKSDVPTLEHSNVVRMFRAMPEDSDRRGIYSRYLPGIGTPFHDIGDRGGDDEAAVALMGAARIAWAFQQVQDIITDNAGRYKEIKKVCLSVFGFSRGAALARAFLNELANPKKGYCTRQGDRLAWKNGGYPVEVHFVGIWDTVAAVGVPLGFSNVRNERVQRRIPPSMAKNMAVRMVMLTADMLCAPELSPAALAFGAKGADPMRGGKFNGHSAWGAEMSLADVPMRRCVHIISAHEQRNSFPVDSVLQWYTPPANTVELVFPGVHSDVGGGYRPGEQGKAGAARAGQSNVEEDARKLSQISLNVMYNEALAAGVPLLHIGGDGWGNDNTNDFAISPALFDTFNHYMSHANADGLELGAAMLRHMRLYFEWRFQHIRNKGRDKEGSRVKSTEQVWHEDDLALNAQRDVLVGKQNRLKLERLSLSSRNSRGSVGFASPVDRQRLAEVDEALDKVDWEITELDQRIRTLPSQGKILDKLNEYDRELLEDARMIFKVADDHPELRERMRPHYRNVLEAYENEYLKNCGMRDPKLIEFFEKYVHDSMAGFGKDLTLPSDPRVVFLGGDLKSMHSMEESHDMPGLPSSNPVAA